MRDPLTSRRDAAGVYVHVPFCSDICPYCDFAVVRNRAHAHPAYVASLVAELAARADEVAALGQVDTIYFGGGTPSVLRAAALEALIEALRAHCDLADDTVLMLEANPEDIDATRLAAWRALGIGVLSLGVQSLDEASLRFLGRRHTAAQACRAIELALEAGFDTVSFDLIYGLPEQQPADWERTLEQAIALGPDHLSCYQLTLEPRTSFARQAARHAFTPLPNSRRADLFFLTHDHLGAHGFDGYEVSNFARAAHHRSRHNQKYWRHIPYLGLGPSAHSFDGCIRAWNERHVRRWQRRLAETGSGQAGSERLTGRQLALEALMLGLRTRRGVDLGATRARFCVDLMSGNQARLDRLSAEGLLVRTGDRLCATLRGMAVADRLAREWTIAD